MGHIGAHTHLLEVLPTHETGAEAPQAEEATRPEAQVEHGHP